MKHSHSKLINNKYGRKIGGVKLIYSHLCGIFGLHTSYKAIDWSKVQRTVFICQGNICRSAYADVKAKSLGLVSASAGLGANKKGKADPHATLLAQARNINLKNHVTTHIGDFQMRSGDLFICMEPSQACVIKKLLSGNNNKDVQITLLGLWANEKRPYLQDPYGLKDEYWYTCLDIIDSSLESITANIQGKKY